MVFMKSNNKIYLTATTPRTPRKIFLSSGRPSCTSCSAHKAHRSLLCIHSMGTRYNKTLAFLASWRFNFLSISFTPFTTKLLFSIKSTIQSFITNQIIMHTFFNNMSIFKYINTVCLFYRAESMSNNQRRTIL